MYQQAANQTYKSFQIYVTPTITNATTSTYLLYTHSEGMGTFLITGIYFYVDSASGTAGTYTTLNVGTNSPAYSNLVTSGSISYNGGSNFQTAVGYAPTNPVTGISGSQQIYAKINRTGTNFVTGSIVLIGYHSNNPGDLLGQDQ